ncbi:Carbonic anhydrase or acetyltransferase, isoleucine patch superfamily [Haloechinothrix alba]|uniref:Carbonic anhydrase or acetyltransferase, isoleucine patch superfamily n=1 Tax=Haloechinothrix alba TaxID=664784 RepID=A0A238XT98_9PSEU|nr:gamma carbonic anhydrase family protein [Haloechinothrix alba]SNR62276.1 Carbonic anhydrase or acetyltransferase, isoleucine patch superfamily [Haloechinothrix alba]
MPMFAFEGSRPNVHPDAWVAPTATLVGDVTVEAGASIWYGAVLRADFGRIVVGAGANIQDNAVVHLNGGVCEIGKNVTVGHMCLVHDCTIGEQALIGNSSTVLDRSVIGAKALVAAGSVVTPDSEVAEETIAMGSPAKKHVPLSDSARVWVEHNAEVYQQLAERHRAGVERIDE